MKGGADVISVILALTDLHTLLLGQVTLN